MASDIGSKISSSFQSSTDSLKIFFKNCVDDIKKIGDWVGSFFEKLLNLFVPTDEQWQDITTSQNNVGETVKAHLPFVSLFNNEYKKAQETVSQTDFLVITIPEFIFEGGGIVAKSDKQKVINVRDKYEPYRQYIRTFLLYIVYACAFVLIIRHVLIYTSVYDSGNNDKGGANS